MSLINVDKIAPSSGTGLTLGDSGDTFTIPSGATASIAGTASIGGTLSGSGAIDLSSATVTLNANMKAVPAWHAHLSSSYNVNNGTETAIPFDTEVLDSNSAYNTSNGQFTVPSGLAGKYFVYAQCMRNNFFNSRYLVKIRVGGTSKISAEMRNSDTGGTTFDTVQVAGILDLSVGNVVDVSLYQDSGDSSGANGGSSSSKSHFMGYRLIGV